MEQLPEAFRKVLTLVDIYDFDYVEAAETLRVPIGTVKSRLARARLQMKNLLQGAGGQTVAVPARPMNQVMSFTGCGS